MAEQQVLDLFRGDLLAPAVDLIFLAPLNGDVALFINGYQIAGAVKAVLIKGAGIVFRAVVIAAEGIRAARHQPSCLTARQRVAIFIGHPDFIVRAHRAALGGEDALVRVVQASVIHQSFGHAEHLLKLAADLRRNARGERVGKPCTADLQQFQRCQLAVVAPLLNGLQPEADGGRYQRGDVNLVRLNQREAERRARVTRQHHAAFGEEDAERARGA